MISEGYISGLDTRLKLLILLFTITLSIGFFTGVRFVHFTTEGTPGGIVENYQGNENDENAQVMKFKKSDHEMLNILHTHLLSMSMIFLVMGVLVYGCRMNTVFKTVLMTEPMISVLLTFGGIYFLWQGFLWMSYVVMISGILMTLSFGISAVWVVCECVRRG